MLKRDGMVMMVMKVLVMMMMMIASWCGVDDVNDRPVGNPKRRYDEHISKFSLSYETKVINPEGESQT
jgi:hypothetical protein